MDSQIRGFEQAVRNSNDGISMLQTADGAAAEITDLLQRMRELTVQGQNDTNSTTDLSNLNEEFVALGKEITRIATDTEFNGIA
jgi:flagellin